MAKLFAASAALPQPAFVIGNYAKRIGAFFVLFALAACQSVIPKGNMPATGSAAIIETEHRVALLLPLSGPDAEVGQAIANATTLALIDTKNSSVRMTTYDTALGVDAAARKAVAEGNRLILGPLRGDDVVGVSNVARPAKVPVISFSNDIGAAGQNVFLLGILPGQSIDRVIRYAKAQGMTKFGAIVPNSVYGQRAESDITKSVRTVNGTLIAIEHSDGSNASINAAAKKLAAEGSIGAIVIADTGKAAVATVPAIRKNGLKSTRILGTNLWGVDSSIASNPALQGAWFATVADNNFRNYSARYLARFGKTPQRISSLGYDSVLLVARVAEDWKFGTPFPVSRLLDPGGFAGIDGAFRFFANGLTERTLEVDKIENGKFVTIDPAAQSFTTGR